MILICAACMNDCLADPMSAVQLLRVSGCGGLQPAVAPLQVNAQLAQAAALWASGKSPLAAAEQTGYRAAQASGLRLSGSDDAVLRLLRRSQCREVADRSWRDVGAYRKGFDTWVLIASRAPAQPASATTGKSLSAARVLQLVNAVRATGTRCGEKSYGPAPPLQESVTLDGVAHEHAADMARHDYFEHLDLSGHTPADRVRASGYREKLVGENIAYGPPSAEEVVAGWLHSVGHCENIMDTRFAEMGLALAAGRGSRHGLYWDQVLTDPVKQP
jgi:uncharacterized protein YkwD